MNYTNHYIQMRKEALEAKKIRLLKENGFDRNVVDGEMFEALVLHESEFLGYVVKVLTDGFEVESSFLCLATRVSSHVFDTLKEAKDSTGIFSIVDATIGILNFAKIALENYGIAYFATISCDPDEMTHLGEGYYRFCIC